LADESGDAVTSSFGWTVAQLTSQLWFRVSLFAAAAVLTAIAAVLITPLVPDWISANVAEDAAWDVLSILASSMLVVATFSLGTMVQAFAAAASQATPRAARVLIDDPFSQNVLATFLGAFVFAMVGLVALGFGYYSREGETVLLVAAGLVILIVLATFFAWLDHLANMVRLGETVRKIEVRASRVLRARAQLPRLGGTAPTEADRAGDPLPALDTLYVVHVDMPALQAVAERAGGRVAVACPPGALAGPTRALVRTDWRPDADEAAALRRAFTFGNERSLDQDPRFCLQVLAEIGSRALSPGINDPGTAIGIIAVQQRLLTQWAEAGTEAATAEGAAAPRFPRVAVGTLTPGDLFEDAFGPLVRDGAKMVEVGLRLQKSLAALAALRVPDFPEQARRVSALALAHADAALAIEADRHRLAEAAARVGAPS
jgi:uncharacterized membrane protein